MNQSGALLQLFIRNFVKMASQKKKMKHDDPKQQTVVLCDGSMSCVPMAGPKHTNSETVDLNKSQN